MADRRLVLAATLLAAALAGYAASAGENRPAEGPVRIVEVKALKVPWSATRASWEQTKDVATTHWRAIPFAQLAAGMFLLKTALSTPYDLVAAPFRQKSRSEVDFEIRGRLVDSDGKPAADAKVIIRCTSPWEPAHRGQDFNYYETARFGPASTDGEGRLSVKGTGLTGLAPKFMVHLDLAEGPKGAASAGAFTVTVSTSGTATVAPDLAGSWRLVADSPPAAPPAAPAAPAAAKPE